jgi:hypothetical protein
MADNAIARLWQRVKEWFDAEASHLHRAFFAEEGAAALRANDSYLRLSVSELFVAKQVAWGVERYPALQASARLLYGGGTPTVFATLARPPADKLGPGVFQDYELTYLLPYLGQAVELEVSLYEILGQNHLGAALDILSDFASLVTPPVSAALGVMEKVATGIERVIAANGTQPVLGLHATLTPDGGVARGLRPGWLAVVRADENELPAAQLCMVDGRLHRAAAGGSVPLTGFDYFVLRVEGKQSRAEGNEWRTPDLDTAIAAASFARDVNRVEEYKRLREEALSRVWFSTDFTPGDRKQIAAVVREELDDAAAGAAGDGDRTVASIVSRRGLPSRDEVADLTLAALLA